MTGSSNKHDLLRSLPAVDKVLSWEDVAALGAQGPRWAVVEAVRTAISEVRDELLNDRLSQPVSREALIRRIGANYERLTIPSLGHTLNATGVVLHTNLGRAPLAAEALNAIHSVCDGYSSLEIDLNTGRRGSRHVHLEGLLQRLTGAEAALVVNNNAAAVMLVVAALADRCDVVVSRGELVEIGGAFRIPDVLAAGGARLVEVGTTNRTRIDDYRMAVGLQTRLLLKVHRSNFALVGFVEEVEVSELARLGRDVGLPVVWDLGSGCLVDLRDIGLPREPTVSEALASGADLVTFSGDKLLGGPQAGIVAGRRDLVERMKRHPLARALRCDKATIAALDATLRIYLDGEPFSRIPVLRMLSESVGVISQRAHRVCRQIRDLDENELLEVDVIRDVAAAGGGTLPGVELETACVRLRLRSGGRGGSIGGAGEERLAASLRSCVPPVVGRAASGALLLDMRTIADEDVPLLARLVVAAANREVR